MKMRKGKSLTRTARCFVLLSLLISASGWVSPAKATEGDVYDSGTRYCASTYGPPKYSPHPAHSAVGGTPVDLNVGVGWDDYKLALHAPEDGSVSIVTDDNGLGTGWGNSITWTNGDETLYLAHLYKFGKTGTVKSGEIIGYVGNTGKSTAPHLHIQSSKGKLVLSGNSIVPGNFPACKKYTSKGPIAGGGSGGNLSIDKVQGSKEDKDDWVNSFELSLDDIYDMDFRAKLEQEDGAWPSDTEASFYLSLDKKLDSGDIFLGSEERDLTKEKAKKKSIYLKDVDMADYITAPGTYYVLTKVEFDGGEDKSSSSDSKQRVKLTVIDTTVPDVTISSFQLNSGGTTLNGGSTFGMKVAVQNIGDDDASSFQIRYRIKGPGTGYAWHLLGDKSFAAGSIAAGATVWDTTNNAFAASPTVEGDYQLESCVDSAGTVTESNEGNNCTEITVYVSPTSNPSLKPVYRFWSDMNHSHFYTISEDEKNTVINKYTDYEWRYEGIGWCAYTAQEDDSLPVYRFWSNINRSHFYTISQTEKEHVEDTYSDDEWRYERIEWYAFDYAKAGTIPVYRFWSDMNRSHFYTASETEKQKVIDQYTDYEWEYEGVGWWVYPCP